MHFCRIKDQIIACPVAGKKDSVCGIDVAAPAGNTDAADGLTGNELTVFFAVVELQVVQSAGERGKQKKNQQRKQQNAYFAVIEKCGRTVFAVAGLIFHIVTAFPGSEVGFAAQIIIVIVVLEQTGQIAFGGKKVQQQRQQRQIKCSKNGVKAENRPPIRPRY